MSQRYSSVSYSVAAPRFPRRGTSAHPKGVGAYLLFGHFCFKTCIEIKEFRPGAWVPSSLPPMLFETNSYLVYKSYVKEPEAGYLLGRAQCSTWYSNNSKYIDIKIEMQWKHNSVDIPLIIIRSAIFVWHLGQQVKLNTTCDVLDTLSFNWHLSPIARSIGSSGRVGGAKKHEIYVAAFGGHLFYDLFVQGLGGAMAPSAPPWIRYWARQHSKRNVFHTTDWLHLFVFTGGRETELAANTVGTSDHGHGAFLRERIQRQNIRGQ